MATANSKTKCLTCGKEKVTYDCKGCLQAFCLPHLVEHQKLLTQQLDDVEHERNLFKQTLDQHQPNTSQHPRVQQINQWEQDSIRLIQRTAEEARLTLRKYTIEQVSNVQSDLKKLTDEMRALRHDNDFNEIHLNQLKTKLEKLEKQLSQSNDIQIKEGPTLIKKLHIVTSSKQPNLSTDTKCNPNGVTVAGGHGRGEESNQFCNPSGIHVNDNETIYIADQANDRIVERKKGATNSRIVAGGNGRGKQNNQLFAPLSVIVDEHSDSLIIADYNNERVVRWPRGNSPNGTTIISNIRCTDLFLDRNGSFYVCDEEQNEVRRWKIAEIEGRLVAGGNGRGDGLNQFNGPRQIFVDDNESVYVSDLENHRVMKWTKGAQEGSVVAGGYGEGSSLAHLSYPLGLVIDRLESIYIVDYGNNRVMRWLQGAKQGEIVVGGKGQGNQPNQLCGPTNLAFDAENSLFVVDQGNHRVQKFSIVKN